MDGDNKPETEHQKALEQIYTGRITRHIGFCEIPVHAFIDKIDADMPELPPVAFYRLDGDQPEVIRAPDQPLSPMALAMNRSVWVKEEDFPLVREFATRERMELLRKNSMAVVQDLFEDPSPENIRKSTKLVGSFVYLIMKDPKAYALLATLSSHDPYTLQHSVGTAIHCIIVGRKLMSENLGISSESELVELGLSGLLHDIGKTKVSRDIINKNGPLDELEWEEMRGHAEQGYAMIKNLPGLTERTKHAVLEHHEDKNGTGYPSGKRGKETDLFSRIVCLCDIFNALTTDRTYSKARTPFDAFQFMRDKLPHKYDEELFKHLVLIYGPKPGG